MFNTGFMVNQDNVDFIWSLLKASASGAVHGGTFLGAFALTLQITTGFTFFQVGYPAILFLGEVACTGMLGGGLLNAGAYGIGYAIQGKKANQEINEMYNAIFAGESLVDTAVLGTSFGMLTTNIAIIEHEMKSLNSLPVYMDNSYLDEKDDPFTWSGNPGTDYQYRD